MRNLLERNRVDADSLARDIRGEIEQLRDDPEFMAAGVLLDVNEQICSRMDVLNLSRGELAKRLGWTRGAVSKMLNGNNNISIVRLAEVASVLETRLVPPRMRSPRM